MKKQGNSIELRHIDDSHVINYHEYLDFQGPELTDDYRVFVDGLNQYFLKPFERLDSILDGLPSINRFYIEYRAAQVAGRIKGVLKENQRTLLVCEYTLWRLVSRMLTSGGPTCKKLLIMPWTDLSAALVIENPYQFWALGFLDDYPGVVKYFYRCLEKGSLGSFDKMTALNKLIDKALMSKQGCPSVRKIACLRSYFHNILCAHHRLIPLPVTQLHDAAHSCVGRPFARILATVFLSYPVLDEENILEFMKIYQEAMVPDQKRFEIPDLIERTMIDRRESKLPRGEDYDERMKIVYKIYPAILKSERKLLEGNEGGVSWQLEQDYIIYQLACGIARDITQRRVMSENYRSVRNWGTMGSGIHMKATIASRATGENAIYIKRRNAPRPRCGKLDEATPIAFLFEDNLLNHLNFLVHDSNITQRKRELMNHHLITNSDPKPDFVNSLYATYNECETTYEGHLNKMLLTSIVFLYTQKMGTKRYAAITRGPAKCQCRIHPNSDPELEAFCRNELGVAWAVKYAMDTILVVAKNGWRPSPRLADFARTRRVEIITVPLSAFSQELITRLRTHHDISTALKKHPQRDQIVERFLP